MIPKDIKQFQLLLAFQFVLTNLVTDTCPLRTTSSSQPAVLRGKSRQVWEGQRAPLGQMLWFGTGSVGKLVISNHHPSPKILLFGLLSAVT